MKAISEYNSSKISILSTVLIVMMMYRHAYFIEAESGCGLALGVQRFIDFGICGVTNFFFFLLSGYLFFINISKVEDCLPKMKKRAKTLLVPYVIWNCVFILWYIALSIIPGLGRFINNDVLSEFSSIKSGLYYLLIKPANFPLWFLRDLIILTIISPVIYWGIRYLKWFAPLLLLIATPWIKVSSALYFVLGGCLAQLVSLEIVNQLLSKRVAIMCALVYIGDSVWHIFSNDRPFYLEDIMALCGIITIWKLYDYLSKGDVLTKSKFWKPIIGYSFFIYVSHEPALNVIKKIPIALFGSGDINIIIWYLLVPIIYAAIAIVIAKLIKNILPHFYSVIVGNR